MRYREKDEQIRLENDGIESYSYQNNNGQSGTASLSLNTSHLFKTGKKEMMRDIVTKNFHSKIASGAVVVSPMWKFTTDYAITPGAFAYRYPKSGNQTHDYTQTHERYWQPLNLTNHAGPNGHLLHSIDSNSLITRAGTEANANVRSPEVAGLVSIAELRETYKFLRKPLEAFTDLVKKARKKKNSAAYRRKQDRSTRWDKTLGRNVVHVDSALQTTREFISNNWLGYRYGVRPIITDIGNVMSAIAQDKRQTALRQTARGYAVQSQSNTHVSEVGNATITSATETEVQVRAGILYEVPFGYDRFGGSFSQIPVAAWEVIPFSFVADWFGNFGSYIEAVTPKAGVRVLASWTTVRTKERSVIKSEQTRIAAPRQITSSSPVVETINSETTYRMVGTHIGLISKVAPLDLSQIYGRARVLDLISIANTTLARR